MYKKEMNERSPMRVFERSIHGGLGKGNVGVVTSRSGAGKTAFLVGISLDDLMRERKVLHLNIDNNVEKVREFYDELFNDLANSGGLKNKENVHLSVERHRLIQTYGRESFSMDKVKAGIAMAKEHMHFEADTIILDGYPSFSAATEEQVKELKDLASENDVELWIAARAKRDDERNEKGIPTKIARFDKHLSVIVHLEPTGDHIRLDLQKDHENEDVADLFLELDPATLLLKWR